MPEPSTVIVFAVAALALLVTPGPAVLYIVTRTVDQGRPAGVASVLGIELGNLVHVAAATLGLSALLLSSALAFTIVKYLGAAYLVYLGVRTLLSHRSIDSEAAPECKRLGSIFGQGLVVGVLNPKTALFFFAFLPQFVDPTRGSVAGQIFFLGCLFVLLGICSDILYALLAGSFGRWIRSNVQFLRAQRYFTGTIYIGLGLSTAFAGSERK